jgi:cation diffusion facilitator CzcD-associated flavoprotein CzcO
VHPQFWPEDLDYAGKQVVVIGSGATAVTLVPELAREAAHVTMLQRSPTYVVSRPSEDAGANWLRAHLPERVAYGLTRWRNVLLQQLFFKLARSRPGWVRGRLLDMVRQELGADFDVDTHFTPRYDPWDQRICLVPDADLFASLREQRASVVTDEIETWTPTGIRLKSGRELQADIIVSATGLRLQIGGGATFSVDGTPIEFARTMVYKGTCYSGVPNLASAFGYTNASWTLKCDLTCEYVCRLLQHMDRTGTDICVAPHDPSVEETAFLDFSSGYVQRARNILPRQGARKPWRLNQNYARDLIAMRWGRIDDGVMRFSRSDRAGASPTHTSEPALSPRAATATAPAAASATARSS